MDNANVQRLGLAGLGYVSSALHEVKFVSGVRGIYKLSNIATSRLHIKNHLDTRFAFSVSFLSRFIQVYHAIANAASITNAVMRSFVVSAVEPRGSHSEASPRAGICWLR
jgi:hypothetical protein